MGNKYVVYESVGNFSRVAFVASTEAECFDYILERFENESELYYDDFELFCSYFSIENH